MREGSRPPRIYRSGDYAITPDGPGIFLGYATYEVIRLGAHAGRRQYVWTDRERGGPILVHGPLVFHLADARDSGDFRELRIRGYEHDQMPAQNSEGP